MIRHYILNLRGEPVEVDDFLEWARWFEHTDQRVLKQSKIGHSEISTVFLGLDHGFSDDGPPVLWETMIFRGKEWNDDFQRYFRKDVGQERYTSKEEALRRHDEMVAEITYALERIQAN